MPATPDIFLHCTDQYTKKNTFQIWLNRKEKGFVLAKEGSLPKSAGAVSFADMGEARSASLRLRPSSNDISVLLQR